MKKINELLSGLEGNYILPFLWMKGEDEAAIKQELDKIYECGIREVCLESRPHPDFLGKVWWENLDLIIKIAKEKGMRVWVLDDDKFPTGHCHGAFLNKYPERKKTYLAERHMDIMGPCEDSAVLMENFLGSDGKLLDVFAFPKPDGETLGVCEEGAIRLTEYYKDGFVFFDLPQGAYRLVVLFTTQIGGGRDNYMNLIDETSVSTLIDEIYEPHYQHYGQEFGKTFAGFFSDEPELGNVMGYPFDMGIGTPNIKLPWSCELEKTLRNLWGENFTRFLPALWYETGIHTTKIRYDYMDCMTQLVKKAFTGQVGDWCRKHGVEYIGHIIEDDNAHARLGCSIGHYYREMNGRDMAGIDVVHHQIVPGFTEKIHQWIAGDKDGEFFHYGLTKLASSEARLDPKKKGRALCEIFGNYGWAEGVTFMKWLTNFMLVRGINYFTPHAFCMTFPDRDCPPHFYAQGNNPQFDTFVCLMKYMNRAAHILSEGQPYAPIAVLYHAEAEWCSLTRMLYQKPVRMLMEQQQDCDVVSQDYLQTAVFENDNMIIANRTYKVLVIPYTEYITDVMEEFLIKAKEVGFPVLFAGGVPVKRQDESLLNIELSDKMRVVDLGELAETAAGFASPRIKISDKETGLRTYLIEQADGWVLMLFNENVSRKVETTLEFLDIPSKGYKKVDCWTDTIEADNLEGKNLQVSLYPGEAAIYLLTNEALSESELSACLEKENETSMNIEWKVTAKNHNPDIADKHYVFEAGRKLPNMNGRDMEVNFSGVYIYESEFTIKTEADRKYQIVIPRAGDSVQIIINDKECGNYAGFPAAADITAALHNGINSIKIKVENTLVWEIKDGASTHLQVYPTGLLEQPKIVVYKNSKRKDN